MEKKPDAWKKRGVFALISRRAAADPLDRQQDGEEDEYPEEEEKR